MLSKMQVSKYFFTLSLMISILLISSCNSRGSVDPSTPLPKGKNNSKNSFTTTQEDQTTTPDRSSPLEADGTIVFIAASRSDKPNYEIFLTTPEGLIFSRLYGSFYGQIALNDDEDLIATRCGYQNDNLCILDLEQAIDHSHFPMEPIGNRDPLVQKIELPNSCKWTEQNQRHIKSISWSRDGDVILVCSDHIEGLNSEVWVLSRDGKMEKWSESQSMGVVRVIPSPVDDQYIVNYGHVNDLRDEQGQKISNLPDGINHSWSPDGKRIAYFALTNSPRSGLAIFDLETNEEWWLYRQPEDGGTYEEFLCVVCEGNQYGGISWSPDGNKLVFSATHMGGNVTALFIADVETKTISYLIPALNILDRLGSPVWSSIEYK